MFDTVIDADQGPRVLLEAARAARAVADAAEAEVLAVAVAWAHTHPADSIDDAAVLVRGAETALAVAGEGAPLVAEFCVAELAAVLRSPTRVGAELIGQALELAHRLPRVWARVQGGDLPAWRARRIAGETIPLTVEAAAYVDAQVAPFAHRVGPAATERLVAHAIARFMPEHAEDERLRGAEARHATVHTRTVSFQGTMGFTAELDLADALDLDTALSTGAAGLADAGCAESLDVRRALALGDLARGDHPLALRREVVLHVHHTPGQSATTLESISGTHLTSVEQVRAWCRAPHARVTVQPVIDLNQMVSEHAYRPSAGLAAQVTERDRTCVFPWCTRRATACDLDHTVPWDDGGPTSSDNLAPLCRHHHRLKTHAGWTYTGLDPGTYLWASPHGQHYLRHPDGGTSTLEPDDTGPSG